MAETPSPLHPAPSRAAKPVKDVPAATARSTGWRPGRASVVGVPYVWLLLFFALPFLIVLKISVSPMDQVRVGDILTLRDGALHFALRFENYAFLAHDELYLATFISSVGYAAATTALCLALGFPFAYFIARARPTVQPLLLMLVMLPFWTSFLLRVYAWKGLLTDGGLVWQAVTAVGADQLLLALGLIEAPGKLMNTPFSLLIGMVYNYLPFMILPLVAQLAKLDGRLLEAAADLGATPAGAFWRVTVPLARGGIVAGSMLVFIPCVGEFVIPELLGGPQTLMIGRVLWDEFFGNNDWPMASSVAVALVVLVVVPLALWGRSQAQEARP